MGAQSLNIDDSSQAIRDVTAGAKPEIDNQGAQTLVQNFLQKQGKRQRAVAEEEGKVAKEADEAHLTENVEKEGVVTPLSGSQYVVLKEGSGKKLKATDQVIYHYKGMLHDDTLFDNSIQHGEPAAFTLNQVIAGWTEGLQLIQKDVRYRFFVPYHLEYGERGAGNVIPPFSTLVFDIELIEIIQ